MAAKPKCPPRMRYALRTNERRETAMAEAAAGAGGSPGPAAAPSPRGSAGPREDERCPGGANPESGAAAPAADPEAILTPRSTEGAPSSSGRRKRAALSPGREPNPLRSPPGAASPQAADPEAILTPRSTEGAPSSSGRRKRAALSPGLEPSPLRSPPGAAASPQGRRRRSWRRSSLSGRRSRRRSLPPVHREVTELSRSISLELPEVQRLSLLLLSSFQFCARQLQQDLEGSEGFDPELFSAKAQRGSEELQRLLQRLQQDGTLGSCTQQSQGDSLDPALEGSVEQVKRLRDSLSGELQAWDRLLQQHRERSQDTAGFLQQLRSGSAPFAPPPPRPSPLPSPRPDYGSVLARQRPALLQLRLLVDEAQQAAKTALEFHQQSRSFLRDLSEQLASRTFRRLPGSPVRRLLQRRPQKALPEEGEQK